MTRNTQTTVRTMRALGLAAGLALVAGSARAAPASMPTGDVTSAPIGHYELCLKAPAECSTLTSRSAPVKLTRNLWKELVRINNAVNISIKPRTDMEMWGKPELWSYPTSEGDCEDYVLLKRHMLMEEGVPAGSLLITVVRQPNGDGHAVLTVRTDHGDFILDNLEGRILEWDATDYEYLKRQSIRNSGTWVQINDKRTRFVGSVNR